MDTNILLSGLRSREGASFRLIQEVASGRIVPAVTVPLVLEYEDVLLRTKLLPHFSQPEIHDFIDWWVSVSKIHSVHFLWRPCLPDPKDDMLLEAAVTAGASHIISFNLKHLLRSGEFGVPTVTPQAYLKQLKS